MPKVLIAPLDWGLGHATRCIPLIERFRQYGWDITLAADGPTADLLHSDFPDLPILSLRGYQIRYAQKRIWMHIVKQIPGIIKMIQYENNWLKEQYVKHRWDVIVSDNRPGFFHHAATNIYITHQLRIKTGLNKIADGLATLLHRKYIRHFNTVWIPDKNGSVLSGDLSRVKDSSLTSQFIGPLSRLIRLSNQTPSYDILFMLSGPEPQRTLFEKKILSQIKSSHGRIALIRGTTEKQQAADLPKNVVCMDLVGGKDISRWLNDAALVICRSGYSSIMDLLRLSKKALLVPTPGQGEQEYLASLAEHQHFFPSINQDEFDLNNALQKVSAFSFSCPFTETDFSEHNHVIRLLTDQFPSGS